MKIAIFLQYLERGRPTFFTFVFKACDIGHLKSRLLSDLKPSQNVPKHSLFKLCKFHEKSNGHFYARGQNVPYHAETLMLYRPL